jgi:hypothetical protein
MRRNSLTEPHGLHFFRRILATCVQVRVLHAGLVRRMQPEAYGLHEDEVRGEDGAVLILRILIGNFENIQSY